MSIHVANPFIAYNHHAKDLQQWKVDVGRKKINTSVCIE